MLHVIAWTFKPVDDDPDKTPQKTRQVPNSLLGFSDCSQYSELTPDPGAPICLLTNELSN
jgi:hypothetical protein